MGYALTQQGAARLLYQIGVDDVSAPVDLEIMWHCEWRLLRALEVNPALFGLYRAPGPTWRQSDINPSQNGQDGELENPMGPLSVKAIMGSRFGDVR
jgi:hypothetical protein